MRRYADGRGGVGRAGSSRAGLPLVFDLCDLCDFDEVASLSDELGVRRRSVAVDICREMTERMMLVVELLRGILLIGEAEREADGVIRAIEGEGVGMSGEEGTDEAQSTERSDGEGTGGGGRPGKRTADME